MPIEFMDRALNARKADAVAAVAVRGEGVLETFAAALLRSIQDLSNRYQIVQAQRGQTLSQWTQSAILGMFGSRSFALEPNALPVEPAAAPAARIVVSQPAEAAPVPEPAGVPPPPPEPPPERQLVKVALPAEAEKMAALGPDARANETLVESYAQASTQLSTALAEAKEERDGMRRRVEDLQQVLSAAQGLLAGQPLDPTLRAVLLRLSDAAGSSYASFLVPKGDGFRVAAMRGALAEDPMLRTLTGQRYMRARILHESEPRLHTSADALDLGDALDAVEPRFGAVLVVPVRTPRGLLGLGLLYFVPDAALPGPELLGHLGLVARALTSSLELHATLETVRSAERSMEIAVQGTASVRGLSEVVGFLESLRDEFAGMRRRPDVPPWFLSEFTRLSPGLAGALAASRALVAFTRGAIEKEPVALEDLFADLESENVQIHSGAAGVSIPGERVLLRLALKALLDRARHGASDVRVPLRLAVEGGRLRLFLNEVPPPVGFLGAPLEEGPGTPALALGFVRRVVELHGGQLAVEETGPATRYAVTLPLV